METRALEVVIPTSRDIVAIMYLQQIISRFINYYRTYEVDLHSRPTDLVQTNACIFERLLLPLNYAHNTRFKYLIR